MERESRLLVGVTGLLFSLVDLLLGDWQSFRLEAFGSRLRILVVDTDVTFGFAFEGVLAREIFSNWLIFD